MKKIEKLSTSVAVVFTNKELRLIHQAFNEVCNGFHVEDFKKTIGLDIELVRKEMKKLDELCDASTAAGESDIRMPADYRFLSVYKKALEETCREVDEIDFGTRLGSEKKDAENLIKDLSKALV